MCSGSHSAATMVQRALALVPADAPGVTNAIGRGQDPAPVKLSNGTYLFPDIDFGSNVYIRASSDLSKVQSDDANKKTIWTYPAGITVGTEAPDLSQWGDTWVIYVSQVNAQVIRVLQSQTSDPVGAYNDLGTLKNADGSDVTGTYDAHCTTGHPNGKNYLFQSSLHAITITELASPTQLTGTTTTLWSDPNVTIEAPTSWIFNSNVFTVAYASGNYNDASYATNIMTMSTDDDPITGTWVANPNNPVIASNDDIGVYGPGSGGFFEGPDGSTWFAYGAFSQPGGFTTENTRTVRIQKVNSVDGNGVVQPMTPVKATIQYGTTSDGQPIF